jgi:hypothetical protein
LFYAPLQGLRNFCDYLAAKAAAAGLFSTTGAGAGAGDCLATTGVSTLAATTGVGVGVIATIIYFLLD